MSSFVLKTILIFNLLVGFALLGCATSKHRALRDITVGMDKAAVLDQAGNPTRSSRQHGQDRWTYEFVNPDQQIEVVHIFFAEGRVTYIGKAADIMDQKKLPSETFKPVGDK